MLNQPQLVSIIPLLTKQKMTLDTVLGINKDSSRKRIKKESWLIVK